MRGEDSYALPFHQSPKMLGFPRQLVAPRSSLMTNVSCRDLAVHIEPQDVVLSDQVKGSFLGGTELQKIDAGFFDELLGVPISLEEGIFLAVTSGRRHAGIGPQMQCGRRVSQGCSAVCPEACWRGPPGKVRNGSLRKNDYLLRDSLKSLSCKQLLLQTPIMKGTTDSDWPYRFH